MASPQRISSAQDIWICCISSAAAGLAIAFFGCMLSWADHEKRRNDGMHTKRSKYAAVFAAIGSTIFGFSSLVGLFYGPVTLVTVLRSGSLMPANALFSQLFRLRPLTRDDYLGTVVTLSGVLCFSILAGPPAASPTPDQFVEFMQTIGAEVCIVGLLASFIVSGVVLTGATEEIIVAVAVTTIGGVSSAFMDLAAKGWAAALSRGVEHIWSSSLFWTSLFCNVLFLMSMRFFMIYGCKKCDVLLFVPLNTVLNIFYSVLVGMVVLQEWRQVTSWPGLLGASTSMLGGVVMLITGPAAGHKAEVHPDWNPLEPREETPHLSDADEEARWISEFGQSISVASPQGSPPHRTSYPASPSGGQRPRRESALPSAGEVAGELQVGGGLSHLRPSRPLQHALQVSAPLRPPAASSRTRGPRTPSASVNAVDHLVSGLQNGLRPEMVAMNTRHSQAHKGRQRWESFKVRVQHLVVDRVVRTVTVLKGPVTPKPEADEASDVSESEESGEDSDRSKGCLC